MPLIESDLIVGSDDVGHDVQFFGATSGKYLLWDESEDQLLFRDSTKAAFGNSNDLEIYHQNGTGNIITSNTSDIKFIQNFNDGDILFSSDDGSGGLGTYFAIDGGLGYNVAYKHIRFKDDAEARFGAGSDMAIYHDGSNSFMRNDTGNLTISNTTDDGDIIFQSDDGSGGNATYFYLDGGVDNSNLYTVFPDNAIVTLGTGYDFQLFHDGSNSYMVNSTGNLHIRNVASDGDILFRGSDGGSGITALTLDMSDAGSAIFNHNISLPDSGQLNIGGSGDLSLTHDGSDGYIQNATGNLAIVNYADDADIAFYSDDGSGGTTAYLTLDGSQGFTTVQKKMRFADSTSLAIGASDDLEIYHDGNTSIRNDTGNLTIVNRADDGDIIFQSDDGSGGVETYFFLDGSAGAGTPITTFPDGSYLTFGGSQDMQMYHDGTYNVIKATSGHMIIKQDSDDGDIIFQSDDGSGGTTAYLTLDGGLGYTTAQKQVRFLDNVSAVFGTGGDFTITHDATDSTILNATGDFVLTNQSFSGDLIIENQANDSDIIFQSDDGSGGVTPYLTLDGSSAGITVSAPQGMAFFDDVKAKFGNADDLQIYHDGNFSRIDAGGTGDLIISQKTADKDIILISDDGSGGETTYLTLDGSISSIKVEKTMFVTDNTLLGVGGSSDLRMYHDGSDSFVENLTGDLTITCSTDDGKIIFQTDDESGGVETYVSINGLHGHTRFTKNTRHNDNVKAFFGGGDDLEIQHDGSNSYISQNVTGALYIENNATDGDVILRSDDGSGGTTAYLTLDGSATNVNIHKQAVFSDELVIPEYIVHSGDGNTYFGFSGADTFIVHTGGTTALAVDSSQNATFAGTIGSGAITSTGKIQGTELEGTSLDINGAADISGATNFGGDVTLTSAGSQQPLLTLKTTHTTTTASAELQFLKDAADTEDGENLGVITFYGEDEGNNNTLFAHIKGSIQESTNGQEGGVIKLAVATHDGEMVNGLVINDGDAEDEIDVTIGSTATSMTTVAGNLTVNGAIISVGGSNADLNMNAGSDIVLEADNAGGGNTSSIQYLDAGGTNRIVLGVDGDVVQLCNRAANGTVVIKANTSTAGGGGETLVTTFADTEATFAVPVVLEADSTVGWHGSVTRVKILPRDFQADSGGRPAMTATGTNTAYLSSNGSGKLFASVPIPTGFKATHVKIHGSDTGQTFTVYEANIADRVTSTKGTATAIETEKAITNVSSTTTNFILIEVSSDGTTDEIHGGYMTIAKI